jgi:hypothetical protein
MRVHQVEEFTTNVHKLDPVRGMLLHHERGLRRGSAASITHDGETYEIASDGTFDLPADVAAAIVGRPGWYEGPNPFVEEQPSKARKSAAP